MINIRKVIGKCKDFPYKKVFCLRSDAAAIDCQIPMTQELFEYCLDFYLDMDDQRKAMEFMGRYPRLVDAYVKRIEKEIAKTKFPEETPEQAEARWQKLCEKIRAKSGEDAI